MAGRNVVIFSSASSPSAADSARKPQLLTSCSRPTRAAGSSSTISTRSETAFVCGVAVLAGGLPAASVIFTLWARSSHVRKLNHDVFFRSVRPQALALALQLPLDPGRTLMRRNITWLLAVALVGGGIAVAACDRATQ